MFIFSKTFFHLHASKNHENKFLSKWDHFREKDRKSSISKEWILDIVDDRGLKLKNLFAPFMMNNIIIERTWFLTKC